MDTKLEELVKLEETLNQNYKGWYYAGGYAAHLWAKRYHAVELPYNDYDIILPGKYDSNHVLTLKQSIMSDATIDTIVMIGEHPVSFPATTVREGITAEIFPDGSCVIPLKDLILQYEINKGVLEMQLNPEPTIQTKVAKINDRLKILKSITPDKGEK